MLLSRLCVLNSCLKNCKVSVFKRTPLCVSTFTTQASQTFLTVNTNVVKDVILFKYDNPKYFKYLSLFGVSQFAFWLYLSHFAYTTLRDAPVPKEEAESLPWWRKINLGEDKFKNGITLSCAAIGHIFLLAAWSYTIRSVKFLILRKGGKVISFVTYGPFGKNIIMDVPLKNICATEGRSVARVQLPIKVQGKSFFYMLDMRGEFLNKALFDATAGLRRKLG